MTTLVLLLHGVGGYGALMKAHMAPHLPATLTLRAPSGALPMRADGGPQRIWFDVNGITPDNRPGRVRSARVGLDDAIDTAVAETGASRVVLLGFSQGSIMAMDALARGKVSEVIAFAGRLAFEGEMTPQPGAKALLVAGSRDKVVSAEEVRMAADQLSAAGIDTTFLIEQDLGHEIGPDGLEAALDFLGQPALQ